MESWESSKRMVRLPFVFEHRKPTNLIKIDLILYAAKTALSQIYKTAPFTWKGADWIQIKSSLIGLCKFPFLTIPTAAWETNGVIAIRVCAIDFIRRMQ